MSAAGQQLEQALGYGVRHDWRPQALLLFGPYSVEHLRQLKDGVPPFAQLPVGVQALAILLLPELLQYWAHRLLHATPLWRFPAIHLAPFCTLS